MSGEIPERVYLSVDRQWAKSQTPICTEEYIRARSNSWAQHLQDTYDEGKAAARRELEQTPSYIHGFNVGFDEAVKQLSEECIVCGEPYVSHCEMDEPGVDHPSSCRKKHHEFQGVANDN